MTAELLEKRKKNYAALLIREGLNLQKGQRLVISCSVECADFAAICAEAAYDAGCREVIMRWRDDRLTRMKYLRAESDVFDTAAPWDALLCNSLSEEGAAWLAIHAEDPENLKGVDPDRIHRSQIASGAALADFRKRETRNEFPWCVCSIPTAAWAKAVFPALSQEAAEGRLWEEILKASRADGEDAIGAWEAHTAELQRRVKILNGYAFRSLHYENSLGTDLTVELPEGHFWAGGSENTTGGIPFSANIPSEEIYTLPKKDGVNGIVYAAKPLCLDGNIISGFHFVLKDGKITEAYAESGEDVLKNALTVDEGASYLGEVALVPYDSPIAQSGLLFYNTLFDENAACHLAFGEAYPCLAGAEKLSEDELKARGVNFSITHEDFMIGTPDLRITGTTRDGEEIAVFRDGNFCF